METNSTDPKNSRASGEQASKRRPFLKGLLTGGLLGSLVASGVGAFAQHEPNAHSWKGGCGQRHAMRDPGVMRERADYMVERTLSRIDATEEQRTQVKALVRSAIDDLLPLREEHQANRKAMVAALTAPEVDRTEVERIRNAELALAERASKRITSVLIDAADVLNPEQRAQLAEMVSRWGGRHPMSM